VTEMPFYETNVSRFFAAGDCASPFKMIPNAMFQGSNAGAGIARELPRRVTNHEVDRVRHPVLGHCSSRTMWRQWLTMNT
jgi:pyruvate/2-oxoglutarate dehydrogenase complex dihydrolipoamide dehydrogenase (E3) component